MTTKEQPLPHQILILKELKLKKRAIVILPSGGGKTHTAAFDVLEKRPKTFIYVVHKNEILLQTVRIFKKICGDFMNDSNIGILNQDSKDFDKPYLFANISTLSRTQNLEKINFTIQYMVIDEFHHAAADSYKKILDYFSTEYLYGLTATPDRTDMKDIKNIVENNIAGNMDLKTGIRENVLVPFYYIGLWDNIDYSDIWNDGYHYKEHDLDKKLLIDKRDQATIDEYRKHIELENRLTIGFCNSVKHVRRITDKFNIAGIPAAGITYKESIEERQEILNNFRKGIYKILFARDVLNEGVDFPECEAIMFLRPTMSKIVFFQQLGRGLRKREGKKNVLVLDFIGNYKGAYRKKSWLKEVTAENRILNDGLKSPSSRFKPEYHHDVPIVEFDSRVIDLFNEQEYQSKQYDKTEVKDIFKSYIDEIHEKRILEPISINKIKNDLGSTFLHFLHKYYIGIGNLLFKLGYIPKLKMGGSAVTLKQLDLNFDNIVNKLGKIPIYAQLSDKDLSKLGVDQYNYYFGTWNGYLKYRNIRPRKNHNKWSKEDIKKRYFELKNEITQGNSIPYTKTLRNKDPGFFRNLLRYFKTFNNFLKEVEQLERSCDYCKKQFYTKNHYPRQKFCSSKCRYVDRETHRRNKRESMLKETACLNCDSIFKPTLETNSSKRTFCSHLCRKQYNNKNWRKYIKK